MVMTYVTCFSSVTLQYLMQSLLILPMLDSEFASQINCMGLLTSIW